MIGVVALVIVFVAAGGLLYDPTPTWVVMTAPALVFAGALGALWRTYRLWQVQGRWQVWQGAGWFLLAMFMFALVGSGGALIER